MRTRLWDLLFLAVLLTAALGSQGCLAVLAGGAAAGAAGYAYAKGTEERVYSLPTKEVASAVESSLVEMEISPVLHEQDKAGSITKARTATGKEIRVETRPEGLGTEVKIRVGTFGDREIEQLFFQHLDAQIERQRNVMSTTLPTNVIQPVEKP